MNIDWSKAPEGATHYHPMTGHVGGGVSDHWFKPGFFCVVGFESKGWVPDINPLADHSGYIAKLEDWNGEGLPPAGTVCEWKEKAGFSWVKATVLFISESSVVMQREDGFEWQMLTKRTVFRPIRTPEKIAAEEIQRIRDEIGYQRPQLGACPVEAMYNLGYRKFEIVEGE